MGWNICPGRRAWFSLEQKQLWGHLSAALYVLGDDQVQTGLYRSAWWKTVVINGSSSHKWKWEVPTRHRETNST